MDSMNGQLTDETSEIDSSKISAKTMQQRCTKVESLPSKISIHHPRLLNDVMINSANETHCLQLGHEGEQLCRAGKLLEGLELLEAALQAGPGRATTISALYSQAGNACFQLSLYEKAILYHTWDVSVARDTRDKLGEAKANGNLGNALKALGRFEEAITCCQNHLDIARQLGHKSTEARALYNLGNVFYARAKQDSLEGHLTPPELPETVKTDFKEAARCYEKHLAIVRDLKDVSSEERVCVNLGNTHHVLGNLDQAIGYHEERLRLAKGAGNKMSERQAHNSIGNVHIFRGDFKTAAEHYKLSLEASKTLEDQALEAQSCYSLGNALTLAHDYQGAIKFHERHLTTAEELGDTVGESRACWSLANAHTAMGEHAKALPFAQRHLELSKKLGDEAGVTTATMNLADLKKVLRRRKPGVSRTSVSKVIVTTETVTRHSFTGSAHFESGGEEELDADNRLSSSCHVTVSRQEESINKDKDDITITKNEFSEPTSSNQTAVLDQAHIIEMTKEKVGFEADNDQLNFSAEQDSSAQDDFLNLIADVQECRMNEQRATLPNQCLIGRHMTFPTTKKTRSGPAITANEEFLDILSKCQDTRIEDQRTTLQPGPSSSVHTTEHPHTFPDRSEDFFNLLSKVQSTRIEDQRSVLSPNILDSSQHGSANNNSNSTGTPNHRHNSATVTFQCPDEVDRPAGVSVSDIKAQTVNTSPSHFNSPTISAAIRRVRAMTSVARSSWPIRSHSVSSSPTSNSNSIGGVGSSSTTDANSKSPRKFGHSIKLRMKTTQK